MNSLPPCIINHSKPGDTALVLNGIVTPIVIAIGLSGNIYSLKLMISELQLSKHLSTYLRALSLWDMGVLFCALGDYGMLGLCQLLSDSIFHYPMFAYSSRYFHGFLVTSMTGSTWITVAIAIARYSAVAKPFQNLSARSMNARIIAFTVSVAAVLYSIPCHFEIGIESCYCNETKSNSVQMWPKLFLDDTYRMVYRSISYSIFVSVGPFILILLMSIRSVAVLRNTQHAASTKNRLRQRMSLLFSLLLAKFLLSNLPSTSVMLVTTIFGQKILRLPGARHIATVANFSALLNNATNFMIYINPCYSKAARASTRRKSMMASRSAELGSRRFAITSNDISDLFVEDTRSINSYVSKVRFNDNQEEEDIEL